MASDLHIAEHYVLPPTPVFPGTKTLLRPKRIQSAKRPNTFTALEARNYSNREITNFWNRSLFRIHSDTTLKLLEKPISFDFLATSEKRPTDFPSSSNRNSFNFYNVLRYRSG